MDNVQTGEGDPTRVFLRGNPTSSCLWRDVITPLATLAGRLAPDRIGMEEPGRRSDCAYRYADHVRYLDAWFEALALRDIVRVVHDWGRRRGLAGQGAIPSWSGASSTWKRSCVR